ncbi:MAG: hypothetical protein ACI9BO_000992, partial [Zhongshania sp.]
YSYPHWYVVTIGVGRLAAPIVLDEIRAA